MTYLLDTVVVSELRKLRRSPSVERWILAQTPSDLFLSVVTLAEIERGIVQQERRDKVFAQALKEWLGTLLDFYADRLIPITAPIARRWGRLSGDLGHSGADLMIAATALEHGLTVVTRNRRHFTPTGVSLVDPFQSEG